MEFQILGSLEAVAAGECLPLGGLCGQKALATLLLDAGRVVPVTRLVDAIWDDDPPATAAKQARNAVSRLRRLLATCEAPDAIVTQGVGYRLAVPDDVLDARLFEARVSQAGTAASTGQLTGAAQALRSALGLWRGPALDGMPGRVIGAAATVWNERRHAVLETYCDYQLALGRHREILGELSALIADHPLREKPVGQLMLALYRCGRRVDALALYGHTRELLAEEMGLDPDPGLQRLHHQILTADPALTVGNGTA
jgi:DNA-binding SARP family transcriptional activator